MTLDFTKNEVAILQQLVSQATFKGEIAEIIVSLKQKLQTKVKDNGKETQT